MKTKEPMHEWTDPITEEVHTCPVVFMEIQHYVGRGAQHALPADVLLRKIDRPINGKNLRHLRKAVFIIQRALNVPLISTRSISGGYYIAANIEELEQHCEIQEKLAHSMLAGVRALRDGWNGGSQPTQPPTTPKPPDAQGDFFASLTSNILKR